MNGLRSAIPTARFSHTDMTGCSFEQATPRSSLNFRMARDTEDGGTQNAGCLFETECFRQIQKISDGLKFIHRPQLFYFSH